MRTSLMELETFLHSIPKSCLDRGYAYIQAAEREMNEMQDEMYGLRCDIGRLEQVNQKLEEENELLRGADLDNEMLRDLLEAMLGKDDK